MLNLINDDRLLFEFLQQATQTDKLENSIAISNTRKMSKWEVVEYERLPGDNFIAYAQTSSTPEGDILGADLHFQMEDGHPVLIKILIENAKMKRGEYSRLTPEAVRTLPVASLVTQVELDFSDDLPLDDALPDWASLRAEWPKGDLTKVLPEVARLYNTAAAHNWGRQERVQAAFDVSKATAGRMIAKARELGYIRISGAVGRPKAKGTDHGEEETTDR